MFENRYSFLDRTVHRIAFNTGLAQLALADVEDRLYAKQLARCDVDRPVFITALPRAGTTLLLECLAGLPEFASHWYRDMPFVLIPVLWNRLSSKHRKVGEKRERAHGDGMTIDTDSPEALEEVLWKAFWKKHYRDQRIKPWGDKVDEEFSEFFRSHMRKIIHIRGGEDVANVRYVSKNNPNIARLALLRRMFPNCSLVVPFRDPVQHATSLLRQHQNFLKMQSEDSFVLEYMSAVGHYDFGQKQCPIDFDGWMDQADATDPTRLAFWLEYWIAAYRHVVALQDLGICFVSYEVLCNDAAAVMEQLAATIDIVDSAPLLAAVSTIHPPAASEPDRDGLPESLLKRADDLHSQLLAAASRN